MNAAQIKLNDELNAVIARLGELDVAEYFDGINEEYEKLADKEKELSQMIREAGNPSRKVCKNTQELVSLNID